MRANTWSNCVVVYYAVQKGKIFQRKKLTWQKGKLAGKKPFYFVRSL